MVVRVQAADFSLGEEMKDFANKAEAGAIVSFTGVVRDTSGDLLHMEIEHYPGMCEAAIGKIVDDAVSRFSLIEAKVIHRYGKLTPGQQIMMVATAAPHRKDAFAAADFLMDYLKSRAPFWKKEAFVDGREAWVDAKDSDEDALKRW